MTKWIDAHSHWVDSRLDLNRNSWMEKALQQGLKFTLQGGIDPQDWEKQKEFKKMFPDHVGLCFGLHPYWVAAHSEGELHEALDLLSQEVTQALALGETGLDLRPKYENSINLQIEAFESQLEIAEVASKPVVLHIVQAFDEAIRILEIWGVPSKKGMIHSFNGSWNQAQSFLKLGLKLSIGGPLLREKNEKLRQAVRDLPISELLLETDLPDQPGDQWKSNLNPPESLLSVADEVGRLKKLSRADVLHFTEQNFKTLFEVEL
jgi:TatD DNase family protein